MTVNHDPQEWRPSTGLGAVALALFVTACVGLSDQGAGVYRTREWYGTLFAVIAFGALAFVHLTALFLRGGFGVWERVLQLAELHQKLTPPAAPAAAPYATREEPAKDDYDPELQARSVAVSRFFHAGERAHGFSVRKLESVVGEPTWSSLVHFYATAAGGNALRDAGGDTGFTWGHGWTIDHVVLALNAGNFPLPPGPVPVVEVYTADTTRQDGRRQRTTAPKVVNGTAKAVE